MTSDTPQLQGDGGRKEALIIRGARVVTPVRGGEGSLRGRAMGELRVWPCADVVIEGGVIRAIEPSLAARAAGSSPLATEIDARGRVLLPAFVDCHTHLCWGGSRLDEWDQKRRGATYQEILKSGGGIMSTVRAVRAASQTELESSLRERFARALALGATTIEVKSGYGLSAEAELKMLRAIRAVASDHADGKGVVAVGSAGSVDSAGRRGPSMFATALLGHAIDADFEDGGAAFVERTIHETLDAVHAEFPGIAIDAFCEQGAWSLEDTTRLLSRAKGLGHPIRVHADQFTSLGMVERAIELGARSVDHLEASTPATIAALAKSNTVGVLLPCCGFHLDGRFADGRAIIDHGGAVAVATNANPGSAPCFSMPFAVAVAVRHCGLTPHEAITAAAINAAAVLGLFDRGTIELGAPADLVLLHDRDERSIAYEFGHSPVAEVILGGRLMPPARTQLASEHTA